MNNSHYYNTNHNTYLTHQKELMVLFGANIIDRLGLIYFALNFVDLNNFDLDNFCHEWSVDKESFYKALEVFKDLEVSKINRFAKSFLGEFA